MPGIRHMVCVVQYDARALDTWCVWSSMMPGSGSQINNHARSCVRCVKHTYLCVWVFIGSLPDQHDCWKHCCIQDECLQSSTLRTSRAWLHSGLIGTETWGFEWRQVYVPHPVIIIAMCVPSGLDVQIGGRDGEVKREREEGEAEEQGGNRVARWYQCRLQHTHAGMVILSRLFF